MTRMSIAEIKDLAAANHELILDRLGITGYRGNRHIRCPFPNHEDSSPSWRWKKEDGRFYCSCGSGTMIDVIMTMTGCDFGQAIKAIRAIVDPFGTGVNVQEPEPEMSAEERSRIESERQDAVDEVLSAPVQNNVIYKTYMSARMGMEAKVFPTTKVACHQTAKVYGSKGRFLGFAPMIAFEMIAGERGTRTQAMRIYLCPLLTSKLVVMDGGYSINPKKLMPVPKGCHKMTGFYVRFGAADADRWVIAEGIETAAALYQSIQMAPDLKNSIAVAACVNAHNLEWWRPPESARKVIVAADRDEMPNSAGTASRRGEIAGASFMKAQSTSGLDLSMIMPGDEGSKFDWLDHMVEHGPEDVAGHIRAALETPS